MRQEVRPVLAVSVAGVDDDQFVDIGDVQIAVVVGQAFRRVQALEPFPLDHLAVGADPRDEAVAVLGGAFALETFHREAEQGFDGVPFGGVLEEFDGLGGTFFHAFAGLIHQAEGLISFGIPGFRGLLQPLFGIGGVLGHATIMRLQRWITAITACAAVLYIGLTFDEVNWQIVQGIKPGGSAGLVGAVIFAITGIGLGWVNSAADYSRYLPRTVSSKAVFSWTVLGASIVPIILVIYGSALSGSSSKLSEAIAMDPIGALTELLPTWFLIPFALIAILGLVGGAILDLYSSGLTLISLGLKIKRPIAAGIDGAIMLAGTVYIVWFADNFFMPFQGKVFFP